MPARFNALVLESGKPNALAVIRDLGRHGVRTAAGESFRFALGGLSRYACGSLLYPSIETRRPRFQEFLLEHAADYDVIFPLADMSTAAVVEIADELKSRALVAAPPESTYRLALDKAETFRVAHSCGVPHPRTWVPENEEELRGLKEKLPFPLVVKSRISQFWDGRRFTVNKVTGENYVNDWPALLEKYRKIHSICPRPLLQEYIEGDGFGYFALIDKGELLAQFAHRRLREYPLSGGSSTLREGIAPGRMQELGQRLLGALNWSGVAMVEFRRDRRDGEYKVLEVNGRWWGSLPLANCSEVHFPWLYYCLLTGRKVEKTLAYDPGKLCRLLLPNDLLWLGASLSARKDRLKVLQEFLDFRGQDFDILSLSDPLPTAGALWGMLRHLFLILAGKESFSGEYR